MKLWIENNIIQGSLLGKYQDFIIIDKYYDKDFENNIIIIKEKTYMNRKIKLIVKELPQKDSGTIEVLDYEFL